jgi:hypothetical protein
MSDEETIVEPEEEHQTVRRMPDDQPEVGPFFPSGMSAPEAALSGATRGLTDDQKAAVEEARSRRTEEE